MNPQNHDIPRLGAVWATSRQAEIAEIVRVDGMAKVDELATRFAVTPQTIRKDINEMCARGLLRRVHGGVELAQANAAHYQLRRILNLEPKRAIGRAVAGLIPDRATIAVSIGTTPELAVAGLGAVRPGIDVLIARLIDRAQQIGARHDPAHPAVGVHDRDAIDLGGDHHVLDHQQRRVAGDGHRIALHQVAGGQRAAVGDVGSWGVHVRLPSTKSAARTVPMDGRPMARRIRARHDRVIRHSSSRGRDVDPRTIGSGVAW